MAVFNFTVRATDSEGSYSDRQFNITVRNSRVERFMVVDSADAWTSPDGTTWTQRVGQGGITCAYGNGFWLILKSTANMTCLKSTDGVNFAQITNTSMTFTDVDTSTTLSGPTGLDARVKLKFWNGTFYYLTCLGTNGTYALYSTVDGINWKRKVLFQEVNSNNGVAFIPSTSQNRIELYDDNGTLFVPFAAGCVTTVTMNPGSGFVNCMGWSTTDGVTFTPIQNASQTSKLTSKGAGIITRINGVYLAFNTTHNNTTMVGSVSIGLSSNANPSYSTLWANYLYSTDGLNWTIGTNTALATSNSNQSQGLDCPISVNGQIYMLPAAVSPNSEGTDTVTQISYILSTTDLLTWTSTAMKNDIAWSTTGLGSPRFRKVIFKNGVLLYVPSSTSGVDTNAGTNRGVNGFRVSVDGGTTWTVVNTLGNYPAASSSGNAKIYNDVAAM